MGYRFEVWAYIPVEDGYAYCQTWQGQSLLKALIEMRRVRQHAGCVRLEWR